MRLYHCVRVGITLSTFVVGSELQTFAQGVPLVVRGPYLQSATTSNVVVRWRTDLPTETRVRYGVTPTNLTAEVIETTPSTEHEALLTGLSPDTAYAYAIEAGGSVLVGGAPYVFTTAPSQAKPTRIWAIGDAGTASIGLPAPLRVRDAYLNFTGSRRTDVWLMLGDNAYSSGTDEEYQTAVFEVFPDLLRTTPVWPTLGSHDTYAAAPNSDIAYTDIFSLPQDGRAGGVPSGSERYYSFDHGNIHFVCLDSETAARDAGSPMVTWLEQDLSGNTKDWLIVYWHSPPYSKGSHDSDVEDNLAGMRTNVVPVLEAYGVDLVLCGHSHSYERSFLINGHHGLSDSLTPSMVLDSGSGRPQSTGAYVKSVGRPGGDRGTVYMVAGNAGQTSGGNLNHPAMFVAFDRLGSVVIDIEGSRLEARFLRDNGAIEDEFTMLKGDLPPAILSHPSNLTVVDGRSAKFAVVATGTRPLSYQWYFNDQLAPGETNATLNLLHARPAQAGRYSVVVSNVLGTVTSSEAVLTVTPAPPCTITPAGLVAWWPLDGSGEDQVESNHANHVVLIGEPVFGPGKVEQGMLFDGVDDQGDVGASAGVDVGAGGGFTIELWIKPSSITEALPLLEWNNRQGAVGVQFWISQESSGSLFASMATTAGQAPGLSTPPGLIVAEAWQHVALTYERTSGLTTFYVNGLDVYRQNIGSVRLESTYDLFIGRRVAVSGSNYRYRGSMDEIGLYNRALSGAELLAIANAGSDGKCKAPTPPAISSPPVSQTVVIGATATFQVTASGARPLSYQWLYNGEPLAGATGLSLTLSNVQLTASGKYSVVVSNALGTAAAEAMLTVTAIPPCAQTPSGLLTWWRLDGDGHDSFGNQHATLVGSPAFISGKVAQGMALDGADDQGDIDASTVVDVGAGSGFTIELWIKPDSIASQQPLLEWNNRQGSVGVQFWISQTSVGSLFGYFPDVNGSVADMSSPPNLLREAVWQHVALTYDRGSGVAKMYVGGAEVGAANVGTRRLETTYDLFLGRRVAVSGTNFRYRGGMDEVSLYNRALSAGEILGIVSVGSAGKCVPRSAPIIITEPENRTVMEGATASFMVVAAGTEPLSYQWLRNGVALPNADESVLTLDNVQLSQAGRYSVVISNELGIATSHDAMLSVTLPPTLVQVASVQTGAGGAVTVPIQLLANGDENALGFSLNFDPALLTLVSVELGSGAPPNAVLVANQAQAAAGRLGLAVALSSGVTWPRGTQEFVRVQFTSAAVANPVTTLLGMGDVPTTRQISDRNASVLQGIFTGGSVTLLAAHFEGDVAPRPNGDRSLTVIDWVQLGRYVAGLDSITNPDEFQRADCAPRSQSGNGILGVTDWVQAGRYATGLDPLTVAGGPVQEAEALLFQPQMAGPLPGLRTVQITDVPLLSGATSNVPVKLQAQGNENAFAFSVTFDPAKLRFVGAMPGGAISSGILNVNAGQAANGRIGIAMALPTTRVLAPGQQELVLLQFSADATASGTTAVAFGDSPVRREMSDATAEPLNASYNGAILKLKPSGLVLSYSHSANSRTLVLFWPATEGAGFELESSPALSGSPWTKVNASPIPVGDQILVSLPIGDQQLYYRLKKQ